MLMPLRNKKPSILDVGPFKGGKRPKSPTPKRNSIIPAIEKLNQTTNNIH